MEGQEGTHPPRGVFATASPNPISFDLPNANSTSDKKRGLQLSRGDPRAPQSILVLEGDPASLQG